LHCLLSPMTGFLGPCHSEFDHAPGVDNPGAPENPDRGYIM
jgi:hypothetical protein